jgi:hypothetical protein
LRDMNVSRFRKLPSECFVPPMRGLHQTENCGSWRMLASNGPDLK